MQRKVFRIEQMFTDRRLAAPLEEPPAPRQSINEYNALCSLAERREEAIEATLKTLERELKFAHEAIAANKRDLAVLIGSPHDRRMARASGELGAAVEGMEKATVTILKATETIDDSAKSLASALKSEYERGLAQEIQDQTVRVYEACNFQDLAGQRIAKVIATLSALETQLTAMLARCADLGGAAEVSTAHPAGNGLVNGPKLDGDGGHVSQGEIDALFN